MTPEVPNILSATPAQSLDQLLNNAVVLNWEALTQSSTAGRVRIEYHIGADGVLEYLKLWNSAREYWSLICEYSTHLSWSDGPRFCNGYHSRSLGRMLQSIMMNQKLCSGSSPNTNRTLEVGPPTEEELDAARLQASETIPPAVVVRASKRRAEVRLSPPEGC